MNRKLVAVLTLPLLSGCVYERGALGTMDLCVANDGMGPCAEGESCSSTDRGVECSCGARVKADEPACAEPARCVTAANAETTRCNQPPVAVINDGLEVRVAAGLSSSVNANGSMDPDGDCLTYQWSVAEPCAAVAPQALSSPTLQLTAPEAGTSCEISLTVSDGLEQDSTSATAVVIAVGGFVARTSSCELLGEPPVLDNKGLEASPWCDLAEALQVTAQVGLLEVTVAADVFEVAGVVLRPGMQLLGGYDPTTTPWTPPVAGSGGARTGLVVSDDHGVEASPGSGAVLRGFQVYRAADCAGDCALVWVEQASAAIEDCVLGAGTGSTAIAAPGARYEALRIRADSSSEVIVKGVDLHLASHAKQSYGAVIESAAASVRLVDTKIIGNGSASELIAGIRLMGAENFEMQGGSISVMSVATGDTPAVYGLLDGAPPGTLCPDGSEQCGSRTVVLDSVSSLSATNTGPLAVAVALFASEAVSIKTPGAAWFGSGAMGGVGLWSSQTRGLSLTRGEAAYAMISGRISGSETTTALRFAAGLLDGVPVFDLQGQEPLSFSGASTELSSTAVNFSAQVQSYFVGPAVAAGVALFGTSASILDAAELAASTNTPPTIAAGLWSVATEQLRVSRCKVPAQAVPMTAETLAAAHLDGLFLPELGNRGLGSGQLTAVGNQWSARLDGGAEALLACELLAGTSASSIGRLPVDGGGNTYGCGLPSSALVPSVARTIHQLWTIETSAVTVLGNTFGGSGRPATVEASVTNAVGLMDGVPSAVLGSSQLFVVGNQVLELLTADGAAADTAVGIWLHPSESGTAPVLESNAVRGTARRVMIGLRIDAASAVVTNNTIYGGFCARDSVGACSSDASAVAVAVSGNTDGVVPVALANNILDAGDAGGAARLFVVVDQGAITGLSFLQPGMITFAQNRLVAPSTRCLYYPGGYGVVPPQDLDGCWFTANDLNLALADNGGSSAITTAGLCADGIHLDPTASHAGIGIRDAADPNHLPELDIDLEARLTPHDIGADENEIAAPCPVP